MAGVGVGCGEAGEPPTRFLLSSSRGGLGGSSCPGRAQGPPGIFPGSGPRQERQPRPGAQLHLRLTSLPRSSNGTCPAQAGVWEAVPTVLQPPGFLEV